jgi:hypothetical protein
MSARFRQKQSRCRGVGFVTLLSSSVKEDFMIGKRLLGSVAMVALGIVTVGSVPSFAAGVGDPPTPPSAGAAVPGPGFDPADSALVLPPASDVHAPGAAHLAPDVSLSATGSTPAYSGATLLATHSVPWHWVVDFQYQFNSDPFVTTVGTICINFQATYHSPADANINITLYHGSSAVGGPISYPTTGGPWQYCYYGQSTSGNYHMFFQKINNGQSVRGYGSIENQP